MPWLHEWCIDRSLTTSTKAKKHTAMSEFSTKHDSARKTPREAVAGLISSLWWLMLLRGVLLVILGIYALSQPGMTLLAMTQVLGVFVLVDGVLAVISSIMGWTESRSWTIARGVLGILLGIFVLGHPVVVGAIAATVVVLLHFRAIFYDP